MTKPGLTPDEHFELGPVLASIRAELQHRSTRVGNAYPRSGWKSEAGRQLDAAVEALDRARTVLDSAMAHDHLEAFEPSVYYPLPEDRLPFRLG